MPTPWEEDPECAAIAAKIHEFRPQIYQALRNHEIDFDENDTDLVFRTDPEASRSKDDLTFLITARWTSNEDGQPWYDVAAYIRSLFLTSFLTRPITVELLSWQLTAPKIIRVVEPKHPLVPIWPELNSRILRILNSTPKLATGWRSIDPIRMGYEDDQIERTSVTISITVDWTLDPPDWNEAEKEINNALLSAGGLDDVNVEFERGDVEPLANFPLRTPARDARVHEFYSTEEDYPERVPMGADFGPQKYFTVDGKPVPGPLGTIGGYLEIRHRAQNGPWKKYAVTNYHVVRSAMAGHSYALDKNGNPIELWGPPKSEVHILDQKPMGPGRKNRENIVYESPTRCKHNFSLLRADVAIAQFEEFLRQRPGDLQNTSLLAEQRASKARKIQYFDDGKQDFGALYLCSGYRERFQKAGRNHRMDIAFIEVKADKLGDNTIPDKLAWPRSGLAPITVCGRSLSGMVSCDGGASLGRVYKVGASSAGTTGRYNSMIHTVQSQVDVDMGLPPTSEYCFLADPTHDSTTFLSKGDSGSWTFTSMGRWTGLNWGGVTKSQTKPLLGYVIDGGDVLNWVNTLEGGIFEARLPTS